MEPKTLFEKIWDTHRNDNSSGSTLVAVDRVFLHERTAADRMVRPRVYLGKSA